jgi:hypothetical protein
MITHTTSPLVAFICKTKLTIAFRKYLPLSYMTPIDLIQIGFF